MERLPSADGKELRQNEPFDTDLHAWNRTTAVEMLVEYPKEINVDLVDKLGIIPLHLACITNDVVLVKLFADMDSATLNKIGRAGLEFWTTV